jgi:hypothetical protein
MQLKNFREENNLKDASDRALTNRIEKTFVNCSEAHYLHIESSHNHLPYWSLQLFTDEPKERTERKRYHFHSERAAVQDSCIENRVVFSFL